MTTQQLNVELFRELSIIAEDESMMQKLVKYAKKLTCRKADLTLMSKEDFFARIDKSLEQARQGRVHRIGTKEELNHFLNNL